MRRRRNRGTWLPLDATFYGEETLGRTFFNTTLELPSNTASEGERLAIRATPIAFDVTTDTNSLGAVNMRDVTEGQEYFLDRVVGKMWASMLQEEGENDLTALVCMAMAILPVSDQNPTVPELPNDDMDPLLAQNAMAPWIWRRTWVLSNNAAANTGFFYPNNTGAYGSVMDGGHTDAKTKRRIRKEQRLFHVTSVYTTSVVNTATTMYLDIGFDLRLHGAMRKARNTSTFR